MNRFLLIKLLTHYFGIPWTLPVPPLVVIVVFVTLSTGIAVYTSATRMCSMAAVETVNELQGGIIIGS